VDLKGLPGLSGIDVKEGKVCIGSLTTIHSLETSEVIRSRATALFEAAKGLGSWQVRNRGTVGGNLANGAPTADTATPLLAMDAEILTWNSGERRRISASSFWLGAGKTALDPGEMITGVEIPIKQGISSAYTKLGPRRAMDIAIAGAAVVLKLDRGIVSEARIALGGAGPTPIRALSAENYLTGQPASPENISRVGQMAADDSNPRTSSRASREYRLAVIPVLVERTIRAALGRQHDGSQAERPAAGQGGEGR
jgi:xanthine dehydrogenase FAD-binding subunit